MFSKFKYERIPLSRLKLDDRNPRIVMQQKPKSEAEIVRYFFEHENLAGFLKKIASEGRNHGAERPYVVQFGEEYVVIEGNTRIATYKLLTGQMSAPDEYTNSIPHIPRAMKEQLLSVDCAIAPSRDDLLPIMASAHFGLGDKSRWGYLGSRKAVYDEWAAGKSIAQLAIAFDRTPTQITDLLIEYELYLEALKLDWSDTERTELLKPEVQFNPPVRFLQSTGHKSAVGIEFDKVHLKILFTAADAKAKFKHLISRLVIYDKGLRATSPYEDVFKDYVERQAGGDSDRSKSALGSASVGTGASEGGGPSGAGSTPTGATSGEETRVANRKTLARGALFDYPVTCNSALLVGLMKEARTLNTQRFPAAGSGLLRSIIEAILKSIIHTQNANPATKMLSLENALDICLSQAVKLSQDDKKVLKEFKNYHLDHINMSSHAAVVPNTLRLMAARDCIDQFVMRHL